MQLFNYAKCGDVFSAGYITEASSDLRGAAGRGAILRGEDGKEGQWGELIKEIEGERVLGKARGNWGGKDRPVRSLFAIWIGVNDLAIMCDYPGVVMKEYRPPFFL